MSFDNLHKQKQYAIDTTVDKICSEFDVTKEKLAELTEYFVECMEEGLKAKYDGRGLPMIPSFVMGRPDGSEEGVVLAADLGGTNFRVCSVKLNGNTTFTMKQQKTKIPEELLDDGADEPVTSDELFAYMAKRTLTFLKKNLPEELEDTSKPIKMGFTFSFPVDQTSLSKGTLIRWTKGFNIQDTVGKDVVELLQHHLEQVGLKHVRVVALLNDTVGTFLSHCYSSGGASFKSGEISEPIIGCIFGTGTNGCYMEKLENIKKLPQSFIDEMLAQGKKEMCINIEWGSFDEELKYLPTTKYDEFIDQKYSPNPGHNLFEKRVSGYYLGELLRTILVDLHSQGMIFRQYQNGKLPSKVTKPFQLTSEVLSHIEIDDSSQLRETELSFLQSLRLPTTYDERIIIQKLVRAISRRSAYLASVPLAAVLMKTGALEKRYHGEVDIGCDGSVFEFYPGFRSMLRHGLALSPLGPDGERKIHLLVAKDGSGVGAALCAMIA
ncbi:HCL654Wp [Eremothecium sinecaudum]|uniref:Phosphotransferase n=1 Tax=Eremothecium sinecaudum TaxID=45286 RepID=A0A109UY77_9SACH|nr:HCL654Wp [Eremothecium sinecaudum]AMD19497.1 HCL654Wp [Eremothecium sinecaudum]